MVRSLASPSNFCRLDNNRLLSLSSVRGNKEPLVEGANFLWEEGIRPFSGWALTGQLRRNRRSVF